VSGSSRTVRAVLQRVTSASVTAPGYQAAIGPGLLVLLGVERGDTNADVDYIARKVRDLRLFADPAAPDNAFDRSVVDLGGEVMVVSQFTLAADCRKGRRPSFDAAASPDAAKPLYEAVVHALRAAGVRVATGVFQADMQVSLVNDGPVTVLLDSRRTV
jgi:D-aminoacyl-tRNA deacylase